MDGAVVVVAVVVLGRMLTAGVRLTRNGFSVLKRTNQNHAMRVFFLLLIFSLRIHV